MNPQPTIAHYRITSKIGQGGMGEVWRATDTKLGRDVAVKILRGEFAENNDRMARFTREAQLLASLNHPNIAAIYGVEDQALIMELVPGPTLADRISRGPIPLEEALPILKQIAEAMEYAHERGVVHRDLKPGNIKITPDGRVKVLDFGLAKAVQGTDPSSSHSADVTTSPTLTMRATAIGIIMGTAAYMAPEQAKGKDVDRRADIWAFGVVLIEMVTGRPLYSGETATEILAAVIRDQPDIERLPAGTPSSLRHLARRCLEKDPYQRLRDIGEARITIDRLISGAAVDEPAQAVSRGPALPWMVAAILALALVVVGVLYWPPAPTVERPLARLSVDLGPEALEGQYISAAISPDGTRLAYAVRDAGGKQLLATRRLGQPKAMLLPGTEDGRDPFFSPDGEWIGFFAGGTLKKISVEAGAAVTVCEVIGPRGASWSENGSIILSLTQVPSGALYRVSSSGGTPQLIANPHDRGEATYRWPQVLPGGQAVLFTANSVAAGHDNANIEVLSLGTGQWKIVQRGGYFGRYLPSGHLVYLHQGTLFAVPFDLDRLEVRGAPVPVLEDVASNAIVGSAQFDFARNGMFVYLTGKSSIPEWPIVWLDRDGKIQPLIPTPGGYMSPRFSPDGKKLALAIGLGAFDLHVYDWARATMTQITFSRQLNRYPVWTPDGKQIIFNSASGGISRIQLIRSDGGGDAQTLLESKADLRPYSISSDGRRIAFAQAPDQTNFDLWTLPLDTGDTEHRKPGLPQPFLRTPAIEIEPAFSPDNRWIAYASNESGAFEVYVRPFPPVAGGKWLISSGGGAHPMWSRNGRELFYETLDNHIVVTSYTAAGDSFAADKPQLWSKAQILDAGFGPPLVWNLDVSPDGKRFAVFPRPETMGEQKGSVHLVFLLNFSDELRRRLKSSGK